MKMRYFTPASLLIVLVFGITLSSCNSGGNEEFQYSDWDQDGNDLLDQNEFDRAYAASTYFDRWDANKDQNIDESEWEGGVANYWVAYDIGDYGAFSSWDSDVNGNLSDNEFRERIFLFYDKDGDQFLNKEEYENWNNDFNK